MTPKQLQALMEWVKATIDDKRENDGPSYLYARQKVSELYDAFGFHETAVGELEALPAIVCARCGCVREASEAASACLGCGDTAEEAAEVAPNWAVYEVGMLRFVLRNKAGEYYRSTGNHSQDVRKADIFAYSRGAQTLADKLNGEE